MRIAVALPVFENGSSDAVIRGSAVRPSLQIDCNLLLL